MQIQSRFTYDRVAFDATTNAHLVITLTAPSLVQEVQRPPVCVIPAIDVSGSMEGEKLRYAKQSVLKLIDHLRPGDYVGLVAFTNEAKVVCPPGLVTEEKKEALRSGVASLRAQASTNLSDGLVKAIEGAKSLDLSASTLVRVIVLTDGHPNVGLARTSEEFKTLVSTLRDQVTVSAFGYGADADQAMLSSLAETGEGNYAFVQNPDDALAAFGKELGGLLSTYAQNVRVDIRPTGGHLITGVVSDFETVEEVDGEVSIRVPSLLAEETLNLVLAVKLSPQKSYGPRPVNAFEVKAVYDTRSSSGGIERGAFEGKARVQFVRAGDAQTTPTKELDEIVGRAELVKIQLEAESAAKKGDYQRSSDLFQGFSADLAARGHENLVGVARHVRGRYTSAQQYAASVGNRQGLLRAMTRGVSVSSLAGEDAQVLLSANYAISNSAQASVTSAFQAVTPQEMVAALSGTPSAPQEPSQEGPPSAKAVKSRRLAKSRSDRW